MLNKYLLKQPNIFLSQKTKAVSNYFFEIKFFLNRSLMELRICITKQPKRYFKNLKKVYTIKLLDFKNEIQKEQKSKKFNTSEDPPVLTEGIFFFFKMFYKIKLIKENGQN